MRSKPPPSAAANSGSRWRMGCCAWQPLLFVFSMLPKVTEALVGSRVGTDREGQAGLHRLLWRNPVTETNRPRYLTVAEVANDMRVSTMTVYRLIKSGELAAVRVGKSYRIRVSDLDQFLDSRYVETGT